MSSLSRLDKIGTVYSRMSFLVKHGAIRPEYKPMWLDIYEAFPPLHEPRWDRRAKKHGEPVTKILYKEDLARAKFYKQFGERHEVYRMNDNAEESVSQRFVRKFAEEERLNPSMSEEELFAQTLDKLEAEGLTLRTGLDPEGARKGMAADREHDRDRDDQMREVRRERRERAEQRRLERPSFEELFEEAADENEAQEEDKFKK